MATIWFEKALLTSKAIVNGKAVQFEELSGNHGVLALDSEKDAATIAGLDALRAMGVGGVRRVTQEQYENLKKKLPWQPSKPKSWLDEPLKINGKKIQPKLPGKQSLAAPAKGQKSVPVDDVPQKPPDQPDYKSFTPSTRKLGSLAQAPSDI